MNGSVARSYLEKLRAARDRVACIVGVNPHGQCDDHVGTDAHSAFQVVTLSVSNQVVNHENTDEEDDSLEHLEVESHGLTHGPAEKNKEGGDEKSNLERGSNGDTNCKVHLILVCHDTRGNVFCCVSDNGQKNQTNKSL